MLKSVQKSVTCFLHFFSIFQRFLNFLAFFYNFLQFFTIFCIFFTIFCNFLQFFSIFFELVRNFNYEIWEVPLETRRLCEARCQSLYNLERSKNQGFLNKGKWLFHEGNLLLKKANYLFIFFSFKCNFRLISERIRYRR